MQLPEEAPRIPKLVFLVSDAVLLITAWLIAHKASAPLSSQAMAWITACIFIGTLVAILPFVIEYSRRQDQALLERQNQLEALGRTLTATAEQIGIAMEALPVIHKQLQDAALSLQAPSQTTASPVDLEPVMQSLRKLRESMDQKTQPISSPDHSGQLREIQAHLTALEGKLHQELDSVKQTLATVSRPTPSIPPQSTHEPAVSVEASESAKAELIDTPPAEPPTSETTAEVALLPSPPLETIPVSAAPKRNRKETFHDEPGLFDEAAAAEIDDDNQPSSFDTPDGSTRLLVTAYIGIGNKLFIRGDGPGLSRHQGTPLQFVSIGKWLWETQEASAPLKVRLFKNDQTECTFAGEITLDPGRELQLAARF